VLRIAERGPLPWKEEIDALAAIVGYFEHRFDDPTRARVLEYLISRYR
jgi:hypothetical protein